MGYLGDRTKTVKGRFMRSVTTLANAYWLHMELVNRQPVVSCRYKNSQLPCTSCLVWVHLCYITVFFPHDLEIPLFFAIGK